MVSLGVGETGGQGGWGGASELRLETRAVGKKLRSSRLFALRYISTALRPVGAGY